MKQQTSFLRSYWVRYLFFFLFGACAGIILTYLIMPGDFGETLSDDTARGTVYSSTSFDKMKPADILFIDNSVLSATIDVRYSTQLVEARLDISSLYAVKLVIDFGYGDFRILNVQNISVSDKTTTFTSGNSIQINNTGENKYIVQLLNRNSLPHDIRFRFLQNDMPVYSNSVIVNKE